MSFIVCCEYDVMWYNVPSHVLNKSCTYKAGQIKYLSLRKQQSITLPRVHSCRFPYLYPSLYISVSTNLYVFYCLVLVLTCTTFLLKWISFRRCHTVFCVFLDKLSISTCTLDRCLFSRLKCLFYSVIFHSVWFSASKLVSACCSSDFLQNKCVCAPC